MSAQRFVDELAGREILSENVLDRLREKLVDSSTAPSAKALASFLVGKGHLTQEQADDALEAAAPPKPVEAPQEERKRRPKKALESSIEKDPFKALEENKEQEKEARDAKRKKKERREKRKKRRKDKENEWDSPLILMGSAGLILLLLAGGGIGYLLFKESGNELLDRADTAFEQGSYSQAIQEYERFLEDFSSHEGNSNAKINLALSRLRQVAEAGRDPEAALQVAQKEIPPLQGEPAFPAAQEDLAALLPRISGELAAKADEAEELQAIRKYTVLTREALEMTKNTKFLPKRLRDERELGQIEQVLGRIALRQQALEDLEATITAMSEGVSAGDTRAAYAAHAKFVKDHPQLAEDAGLNEAIAKASLAEKEGIAFVKEPIKALTSEPDSPVVASVTTADRRREGQSPARGVVVVRFGGGAYAFSCRDGRLVWRKVVGETMYPLEPIVVGRECFLVDARRKELLRVSLADGKLVWRVPLDDVLAQPLLLGDQLLVPGESGRLHVVDAASGNRPGYVQFAQPLRTAPTVDAGGDRLYLAGEHSSIYTLSTQDLSCLGVFYLGHAKGTVVAPPVPILNRLVIAENDGAATSSLHVFSLTSGGEAPAGTIGERLGNTRLTGLVNRQPSVIGRRFSVVTDSGQIAIYEVSAEKDQTPVSLIAAREPRRSIRSDRFSLVTKGQIWVASTGLSRYSILPSGNRLPVRDVKEPFRGDSFVYPLQANDGVVFHVRRRRSRVGATVSATDLESGDVYWETDIAEPAAGPPLTRNRSGDLLYPTGSGRVFRIDRLALQNGIADEVASDGASSRLPLQFAAHTAYDSGQAVFASLAGGLAVGIGGDADEAVVNQFSLPSNLSAPPLMFEDGWLAPLDVGQVLYLDKLTGKPLAAPFQPEVGPRQTVPWQEGAVAEMDGKPAALLCDGNRRIFALQQLSGAIPSIASIAEYKIKQGQFVSRVAAAEATFAVVLRTQESDQLSVGAESDDKQPKIEERFLLQLVSLANFKPVASFDLGTRPAWGPYQIDGRYVASAANGKLVCVNPAQPEELAWSVDVESVAMTAVPGDGRSRLLLAQRRGVLEWRAWETGEASRSIDVGQPLSGELAWVGDQLFVNAADGSLLLVDSDYRPKQGG